MQLPNIIPKLHYSSYSSDINLQTGEIPITLHVPPFKQVITEQISIVPANNDVLMCLEYIYFNK